MVKPAGGLASGFVVVMRMATRPPGNVEKSTFSIAFDKPVCSSADADTENSTVEMSSAVNSCAAFFNISVILNNFILFTFNLANFILTNLLSYKISFILVNQGLQSALPSHRLNHLEQFL